MVVRAQRGGVLPDHPLSRPDVLLPPQGGEPAGVQLPAFDHSFLGIDFHLHLGGPAPSALHRAAGLGAIAGHGFQCDAGGAELGRHVERVAHAARGVGPGPPGPGAQVPGRRRDGLRHGHAGRSDAGGQERQRPFALHGLDDRACAHRRAGVERVSHLRRALLALSAAVPHQTLVHQTGQLPFLDWPAGHDVLPVADLRERRHPGLDVETVHRRRLPAIRQLPGHRHPPAAHAQTARAGRDVLCDGHCAAVREPVSHRPERPL
ncbi:MAG: hypothetical protein BWX84_03151 [Verrucomicrobia bacterium ADurb.Bin118]|nr:MAG: hypothetical protein BWX84_03151 [Verrucomicrobia bacterium ADurb.Bin118]